MKKRYVYIVFCNPDPIIYSIFFSEKKAMNYALFLIDYRKPTRFLHYMFTPRKKRLKCFPAENLIFSACFTSDEPSYNNCFVQIKQYEVS